MSLYRVDAHYTASWWVLTHHGWLPWRRVFGLSPLAVELYGLLLRLGERPATVTAHPSSSEHASLIVRNRSLTELGDRLGQTAAAVYRARRELEERGLVAVLATAGAGAPCNVYAVVSGRAAAAG